MAPKKEVPSLVKALDFISFAQKEKGAPYQTHVILARNQAIASDGILTAGHKIEEDLVACPHTFTLAAALKKCTGALSLTQLDSGRLSVKSGKFKAFIPCITPADIPNFYPDPPCGVIDNRIRVGLELVSPFIVENAQRVVMASALIRSGSILATNGQILLEYWHGIDMPPGLIVPKLFINALCKMNKDLVSFGFSASSFTVYFDDGSWLRTQLYNDKWPDCDAILRKPHSPLPLPMGFFDALNAIFGFIEDNRLRVRAGRLQSHDDETQGASYEVEGLTANLAYNAKHLKVLDGLIKTIDFVGDSGISYFYGDNLRGAISQIREASNG